jgi:cell filamentation protein
MLENRLGITDSTELAREEERISKQKAIQMFESGFLDRLEAGTVQCLTEIHRILFEEIYPFAGKIREVNISKGSFRFAPVMYLGEALKNIEKMPQKEFEQIVENMLK